MQLSRHALLLLSLLGACVESSAVPCGTGFCSTFTVCGPHYECVLPSQLDACTGKVDGDGCSYPTVDEGVCADTVCVAAGCGNGVVETAAGEVCDDGNRVSFDGCSANCTSTEVCGDGITDRAMGEECDCGDGTLMDPVPGCVRENSDEPGATCRTSCLPARCGDNIVDPTEACDDGNTLPGDGCRADCTGRWTLMNSNTFAELYDVWGSSPTDVYAVGQRRVMHYGNGVWSPFAVPAGLENETFHLVAGAGPNDVHIATTTGKLLYWNGTQWSEYDTDVGTFIQAMWFASPTSGWAAGNKGYMTPVLYRWSGNAWAPFTTSNGMGNVRDLWGIGDVFYAIESSGQLWQWTVVGAGMDWAPVSDASANPVTGFFVAGTAANDVMTTGLSVTGYFWHYDGVSWQRGACCDDLGPNTTSFSAAANDYVLASNGNTMQYDGMTWRTRPTYVMLAHSSVWVGSRGQAFIVGPNGVILY